MAKKQRFSNPLALAVLVLLFERPMHPYEMAATLKERHKEDSIKLRYGSLYTVIDLLRKEGFIVPREKQREGRRPERTVYDLTPVGCEEMQSWMRSILSIPVKEYPQFEAGLSLMPALPPDEVAALLEVRMARLRQRVEVLEAGHALAIQQGISPLFLVESEYELALTAAEQRFVEQLVGKIKDERWESVKFWRNFHQKRIEMEDRKE
ncbi:MAG: helix-turn-helix transcriptional regulator [Syntrophobacteraceae bacterium]